MKYFGNGLSEKHKELSGIIRKPLETERAKSLFLELHGALHLSAVSGQSCNEVDELTADLEAYEYAVMPTARDETMGWVFWHIARIEDLTMNILVAKGGQVYDSEWERRTGSPIRDTGNALTDEEIMGLSKGLRIDGLMAYRNAVGRRTREIISSLTAVDMKRKTDREDCDRILREGGVTEQEDSVWLLDYWGKKDVAGLLLMPPTRHVMLHLNDCCKWKAKLKAQGR